MADPFTHVSAAGAEMIEQIVEALEARAADPEMLPIVHAYLSRLELRDGAKVLDIGAGTGGITRRVAAQAPHCSVLGVEPSPELVDVANDRAAGIDNLSFAVGDAYALEFDDEHFNAAIFHTVLCHVTEPERALAEAFRVLHPGGQLVVCDADFAKLSMGLDDADPVQACAVGFYRRFVTDPWFAGKLRGLAQATGFEIECFNVDNRLDLEGTGGGVSWIRFVAGALVREGVIGQPLADALAAEWARRGEAGIAYGFNPFVTLIARRPSRIGAGLA